MLQFDPDGYFWAVIHLFCVGKGFLINLFIYSFLAVLGLCCCVGFPLVLVSGGYSSLRCTGFSLRWLLLLWSTGSRRVGFSSCGAQALERRLSSCGARA